MHTRTQVAIGTLVLAALTATLAWFSWAGSTGDTAGQPRAAPAAVTDDDAPTPEAHAGVRIVGRVVDAARRPIAGAEIRLSLPAYADRPSSSAGDGGFQIELEPRHARGSLSLLVAARGYAVRRIDVGRLMVSDWDAGEIALEAGGTISGRVVSADGSPVAGARVVREQSVSARSQREENRRGPKGLAGITWPWATSAGDGRFELIGVPAGRVRLGVTAEGYVGSSSELLEVSASEELTGVELRIDPLTREDFVRGVVRDPSGAPLAGLFVTHWRETVLARRRTDERGRFEFALARRAPSDLVAVDVRHALFAQAIDVAPGAELVLTMQPMRTVPVSVIATDGSPVPSPSVGVRDARGNRFRLPPVLDAREVLVPPCDVIASAGRPGFRWTDLGPVDGASVERLDFVIEPAPEESEHR